MDREAIKNNRTIRKMYYLSEGVFKRRKIKAKALRVIKDFQLSFSSAKERNERIEDMVKMYRKYGFTPAEYINYRFEEKTESERMEFVADWEHLGYTCALNDSRNNRLFDNKWETYKRFKKYYKRDMIFCSKQTPYDDFKQFYEKHNVFVIKPLDKSCGKGVQIIHVSNHPDLVKSYQEWLSEYQNSFILEELIIEAKELAKFHPASVNTIRVPTIRMDDETLIIHPQLRMGQHGKVVDNAGAGGVKGAINVENGVIFSAVDNLGHTYTIHPDTGEKIIGYKIPYWPEAKSLVRELAQVVPENRYTGWDLALTDAGWVLVEANRRAQFGFQMSLQQGFRKEINGYLQRLGKKY